MKLSTLNPAQEFILKTLRFDDSLCIRVKNGCVRMYQGKSVLFCIPKPTFENLVVLKLLVEVKDKWILKN